MSDQIEGIKRKRPVWVWVITIYVFFAAGFTLVGLYLVLLGVIRLPPANAAELSNMPALDRVLASVHALAVSAAAVALFMLRRAAFYIFAFTFALNCILTVDLLVTNGWVTSVVVGGPVTLAAICLYCSRLVKRGVLR